MRYVLILSIFFLNYCVAQTKVLEYNSMIHSLQKKSGIITLNLKKDFGALGNGKINYCDSNTSTIDHKAFERAAEFINKRGGNVVLLIPYGKYIVGKQIFNSGKLNHLLKMGRGEYVSYDGYDLMLLFKVKNILIKGQKNVHGNPPVLLFRHSLKFGLFNSSDGTEVKSFPLKGTENLFLDSTHTARSHVGNAFFIEKCNNVKISNIIIDGNADNLVLGGKYGRGQNPIENYHYGIYNFCSRNTILHCLTIKGMGTDGIVINDNQTDSSLFSKNILVDSCKVLKCGRNGLSWLSGSNVTVSSSEFIGMGTGRISTEPCAGIDIESESSTTLNNPSNGIFVNCLVADNKWLALAASAVKVNANIFTSSNMQFTACTFIGSKNFLADIEANKFRFNNCNFYGMLLLRNNPYGLEIATSFNNCNFSNYYKGNKMKGNFLISNNAAKRTTFNHCKFTTYNERIFLMDNTGFDCGDYASYPIYQNCIFKSYITAIKDDWFKTSGLGSKTAFKECLFYFNKDYPYLVDTSKGNMCAQDLGGNKYISLSKKEISNAILKPL